MFKSIFSKKSHRNILSRISPVFVLLFTLLISPQPALAGIECSHLSVEGVNIFDDGTMGIAIGINGPTVPVSEARYKLSLADGSTYLATSYSVQDVSQGIHEQYRVIFRIPQSVAADYIAKPFGTGIKTYHVREMEGSLPNGQFCDFALSLNQDMVDAILDPEIDDLAPPDGACPNGCPEGATCQIKVASGSVLIDPDNPNDWECRKDYSDENTILDPQFSKLLHGSCGEESIDTALGCIPVTYDSFVPALLRFIIGIAGTAALILMIIGAVMVMTGGSNPEQIQRGKEIFTGAIIGLLFIVFSVVILQIIAGDIIKLPGFERSQPESTLPKV